MKLRNKIILLFVIIVLSIFAVLLFDAARIPPGRRTLGKLVHLGYRIGDYVEQNNMMPPDLSCLSIPTNAITDEWGNEIKYVICDEKSCSITSLGKDGRLGGNNKNRGL